MNSSAALAAGRTFASIIAMKSEDSRGSTKRRRRGLREGLRQLPIAAAMAKVMNVVTAQIVRDGVQPRPTSDDAAGFHGQGGRPPCRDRLVAGGDPHLGSHDDCREHREGRRSQGPGPTAGAEQPTAARLRATVPLPIHGR